MDSKYVLRQHPQGFMAGKVVFVTVTNSLFKHFGIFITFLEIEAPGIAIRFN